MKFSKTLWTAVAIASATTGIVGTAQAGVGIAFGDIEVTEIRVDSSLSIDFIVSDDFLFTDAVHVFGVDGEGEPDAFDDGIFSFSSVSEFGNGIATNTTVDPDDPAFVSASTVDAIADNSGTDGGFADLVGSFAFAESGFLFEGDGTGTIEVDVANSVFVDNFDNPLGFALVDLFASLEIDGGDVDEFSLLVDSTPEGDFFFDEAGFVTLSVSVDGPFSGGVFTSAFAEAAAVPAPAGFILALGGLLALGLRRVR